MRCGAPSLRCACRRSRPWDDADGPRIAVLDDDGKEASMSERVTTPVHVVQPDQGESFWQPVPANGYAEVRVSHRKDPAIRSFATGIQVIAPGSTSASTSTRAGGAPVLLRGRGPGGDRRREPSVAGRHDGLCRRRPSPQVRRRSADRPLKMCWVMMPGGDQGPRRLLRQHRPPAPARASPRPSRSPAPPTSLRIEAETVFHQAPLRGRRGGPPDAHDRVSAVLGRKTGRPS